ncbi:uncharacterized protein LOC130589487 [Beta vulgaris subsp. vulgaris]|uniref:uncharacterized protein LOC130589487 n=1 Tax=Beta vulgaris subsp. vulgaris TaxID=3555 RepID=UPI000901535D|nr:uncharacterized protein LOC130589487 [Beta vulgaris subsp. vulgaris]
MTLLMDHSLSPSMTRGPGYNGATNMKGEIIGLKTLIMNDTPKAYYVHYFAHQLQLTLVVVAKKNDSRGWLFEILANLLNIVGVSCKRREMTREIQAKKVAQALNLELESGSRLNQELGLKSPEDTHWDSYYKILINIIYLFPTVVELVETNRHKTYPLIFWLIKLILILPVAIASVERVKMTYVKSKLRYSMGEQLLNDSLVTFIERDVFLQVPDEDID